MEWIDLQDRVDVVIQGLGGYWPPLAAVARILEELGELAEHALEDSESEEMTPECLEEVADLLIVSTCIANQSVDLALEYAMIETAGHTEDGFVGDLLRVLTIAGSISRAVNAIEGDKPLRKGTSVGRIGTLIARFHLTLSACHPGLLLAADRKLAESAQRDRGRFAARFDPSVAPACDRFRSVVGDQAMSELGISRLWGAPDWDPARDQDGNLERIASAFERFCRVAKNEPLDAFVVEVAGASSESFVRLIDFYIRRLGDEKFEHWSSGVDCFGYRVSMHGLEFDVSYRLYPPQAGYLLFQVLNQHRQ